MRSSEWFGSLFLAALVAGCGGGSSSEGADPAAPGAPAEPVSIGVTGAAVAEGAAELPFTVTLSAPSAGAVDVAYVTEDVSARAGEDYLAARGTLVIPAGATEATVMVSLTADDTPETDETLRLTLSNPVGAELATASATGTIIDDDGGLAAETAFDPDWGSVGVFTEAATCAGCHRASSDADSEIPPVMRDPAADTGEDVSPSAQWAHSMMAHAFGDPYYQAKLADELAVFSALAPTIEDKCLTCHAPMGRTHAHHTAVGLEGGAGCLVEDGCYRLDAAWQDMHARESVSCTACHQIRDDGLGTAASFSGGYVIADADDSEAFTVFGPYPDPHGGGANAMLANSGYVPQYGEHIQGSEHCGSCHTLHTTTVDVSSGELTDRQFLEQAPYLEWLASRFAPGTADTRECQSCHQPSPEGSADTTRIAVRPNGAVNTVWPERNPFFVHELVGGNTHVLSMLQSYTELLGLAGSTTQSGFDAKIRQTREFLENQSAALDIGGLAVSDGVLAVDVTVTNLTGHKLPSGFPSRRAWLHVTVRDGTGAVAFESGAPGPDGRIAGDAAALEARCLVVTKPAGFTSAGCFEPHRDVIDDPAQVPVYEAVMADTRDQITHVLLHADHYLKDNRLPPAGFTAARAQAIEPQMVPVGVAGDGDFNRGAEGEGSGTDTVHYRIDTTGFTGPFSVDARLLYQSIRPSFVHSMHSDAPRVNRFRSMYDAVPPPVEVLASASR